MILIDTNVILALLDRSDDNHSAAREQTPGMRESGVLLVLPILAEVTHFLRAPHLYDRFDDLLDTLDARYEQTEHLLSHTETMGWLKRHASHKPDYADAHLVMLTARNRKWRVWSFDSEFQTIWRRPDGSAVPMAVRR